MQVNAWVMKAVGKKLERAEWTVGELPAGEVLVEVLGCGVCHTDLGYLFDGVPTRGPNPLTLGHEIVGKVVEVATDICGDLVGAHVVVPAVIPCGDCDPCVRGKSGICAKQIFPGNDIHGGFASHVQVPAHGLCQFQADEFCGATGPSDADGRTSETLRALAVVADAITTPYHAICKAALKEGDVAVFVGVGGIGAFGAQIALARGAQVVALDINAERLSLLQKHGVKHTFNTGDMDAKTLKKTIRALAKAEGWPRAEWKLFETSGTVAGQELAFELLNFGATLMVVGYTMKKPTVRLSHLMAFEAEAKGVWGCPPALYPEALALVRNGDVKLDDYVEHHPMSDINAVLHAVHQGDIRKRVVFYPDFFPAPNPQRKSKKA